MHRTAQHLTVHRTALHCTALHCTSLYTAPHCTALDCTALHLTALYCTPHLTASFTCPYFFLFSFLSASVCFVADVFFFPPIDTFPIRCIELFSSLRLPALRSVLAEWMGLLNLEAAVKNDLAMLFSEDSEKTRFPLLHQCKKVRLSSSPRAQHRPPLLLLSSNPLLSSSLVFCLPPSFVDSVFFIYHVSKPLTFSRAFHLYAVLCYAMLCYAMLCYAVLCVPLFGLRVGCSSEYFQHREGAE